MQSAVTRAFLTGSLLAALGFQVARAQRTVRNPWNLRPELQLEYVRPSGDFFWGSFHSRHDLQAGSSAFNYNWLQAGYEHFWSEHWSVGANARLYAQEDLNGGDVSTLRANFAPEVLLRHRGKVFGLTFGQRLSVDYLFQQAPARNLGQARLRLDLERPFAVGERVKLRPRVAYEAAANIRLQPPDDAPDERTIEQSLWRAEVGVRLSPHFDLTPYVARQTDYRNTLFQFDSNGNVTSGGRTNFYTPVVGLDLRFTLFRNPMPADWLPLPTQH